MATTISTTQVTAKKDHSCSYCRLVIPKGEKYNRSFVVHDTAYTWKSHVHCDALVEKIVDWKEVDEGLDSDSFYEFVSVEWERIMGITSYRKKYVEMLDYVLDHHGLKSKGNEENVQIHW